MTTFTQDNTNGFSNAELFVMNNVHAELMSDVDQNDIDGYAQWSKNACDAINDKWIEGMNEEDLLVSAKSSLGI